MANIYDGSFVLGDTSATTLSAGPGIKLDTSVPGIIGISKDETVLWSGTGTSAGSLSENPFNFDKIGVYWIMNNDGTLQSPTYQEFFTKEDTTYYLDVGFGNTYAYIGKVNFTMNSTGFSAVKAQGIQLNNWNATGTIYSIDTAYLSKMRNGFQKIVGISRISGDN